jgi:hypothetical protein
MKISVLVSNLHSLQKQVSDLQISLGKGSHLDRVVIEREIVNLIKNFNEMATEVNELKNDLCRYRSTQMKLIRHAVNEFVLLRCDVYTTWDMLSTMQFFTSAAPNYFTHNTTMGGLLKLFHTYAEKDSDECDPDSVATWLRKMFAKPDDKELDIFVLSVAISTLAKKIRAIPTGLLSNTEDEKEQRVLIDENMNPGPMGELTDDIPPLEGIIVGVKKEYVQVDPDPDPEPKPMSSSTNRPMRSCITK